jgi:hypothetical protein
MQIFYFFVVYVLCHWGSNYQEGEAWDPIALTSLTSLHICVSQASTWIFIGIRHCLCCVRLCKVLGDPTFDNIDGIVDHFSFFFHNHFLYVF